MMREICIKLEWDGDEVEGKMSVDGKMYEDYPTPYHLIVDLIKEIDSFEKEASR